MRRIVLASFILSLTLSSPFLLASANYDIKEMTPEVTQALNGRKARYQELQSAKAKGWIGESNQALVKALKNSSEAFDIVSAENSDRQVIYRTIAEQHHLGAAGLSQVRVAFAETQRDRARPGDFIQDDSGRWTQK